MTKAELLKRQKEIVREQVSDWKKPVAERHTDEWHAQKTEEWLKCDKELKGEGVSQIK